MAWMRRYHRQLSAASARYLSMGWPVAPGAWWDERGRRYCCAASGCRTEGLHLTLPEAPGRAARCADASAGHAVAHSGHRSWTRRPYSIVLPTGYTADVLEVPPAAAPAARTRLQALGYSGPVARLPDDGILVFTPVAGPSGIATQAGASATQAGPGAPATQLDPSAIATQLGALGALHHARGSWVPLPPSQLAGGPVRWQRPPGSLRPAAVPAGGQSAR